MTTATSVSLLKMEKILLEYLLKSYIKNLNGTKHRNVIEPIAKTLLKKIDQNTLDEHCYLKLEEDYEFDDNYENIEKYINTIILATK